MNDTDPINVIKYCPKCGSPEFIVSCKKSFKCKACKFHFFINSSAAVAALVSDDKGKLMLVTRGIQPDYGKLDLPGGFVDPGESAENAIIRELQEELGMVIKSLHYIGSEPNKYVFSGYTVFTLDLAFKVIPETLEDLKSMDDILNYKFYSEEELNYNDIAAQSIKKFVKDFFDNERNSKSTSGSSS